MKSLLVLFLLTPFLSFAEIHEVAIWSFPSTSDNYPLDRISCINHTYDLETKVMEKTEDTDVRLRMSHLYYHPIGYVICYAKFFPTEKTQFAKKKYVFPVKKCKDHYKEIRENPEVLLADYENRIKLDDGTRGCAVYTFEFLQQF